MTDVFQVQADIAGQVAQALNVALGDSVKHELAAKPTQNLPAYDAFLRGEAASQGMSALGTRRVSARRLPRTSRRWRSIRPLSRRGRSSPGRRQRCTPVARPPRPGRRRPAALPSGRWRSPPRGPRVTRPLAAYYSYVARQTSPARYAEDSTALALAPGNAELLGAVGFDELSLGRWEAARGHLEQAARLDPRSGATADQLGQVLLYTRHYPEAERAFDHALQLLPANLLLRADRATVALAQGDLAARRPCFNAAPKEVDPTALVAFVANYRDLVWVLDEAQQQLLLRLTPSAFDDSRATWGIVLAQTYALQGNRAKARVYADSARLAFEQQLAGHTRGSRSATSSSGSRWPTWDRKRRRSGRASAAWRSCPISRDAFLGPYVQHQLARIYLLVGEPEKALDQLEPLAQDPVLPLARLAQDRPQLRPAPGQPALRAAGERALALTGRARRSG